MSVYVEFFFHFSLMIRCNLILSMENSFEDSRLKKWHLYCLPCWRQLLMGSFLFSLGPSFLINLISFYHSKCKNFFN